ncbi:hypothetical protein BHE74_00009678 [Ensete ventricosum]|nr:hypothetical protein BHE74_00009678 [Ensete ventricosum]
MKCQRRWDLSSGVVGRGSKGNGGVGTDEARRNAILFAYNKDRQEEEERKGESESDLPETKRLVEGSADGATAAGGGGEKAEIEKNRRNPDLTAAIAVLYLALSRYGEESPTAVTLRPP